MIAFTFRMVGMERSHYPFNPGVIRDERWDVQFSAGRSSTRHSVLL